ncbi:MAG TPA: ABC transporter permease [Candidatus Limnocylindrales bacterium]|nr:ABC transporter permease [Candidatus Limnocylindrales bacterium]
MTRARVSARRLGPALALVAILLAAWEVYARASGVSPFVLPPPSRVIAALWEFRDQAIRHAIPTILETLVGFSVSIAAATAAAIALDRLPLARRAVEPLLVGSQTVPIVAIAPLIVVWFGFGLLPKVLVVVLVTFFPITIALLGGFATTRPEATELMRSFGASSGQTFRKVRWPSGLPGFFTGLRISATYAVVAAVIAEYVGATDGLGIWMQLSQRSFRTDLVFAAILLTAVLSIGLYAAVVVAERAIIPWSAASRGARQSERVTEAG